MESVKAVKNAVSENAELAREYARKEIKQLKLTAFYRLSLFTVGAVKILSVGIFLTLAAFFVTFSAAFYLGNLLNSNALGFLIVATWYLVFGLICYLVRHKIERIIVRKLSKEYFDNE